MSFMKAISVRAPWWWAILYFDKDIENRPAKWGHRGPICLQASKFWNQSQVEADWRGIHQHILHVHQVPPLPPQMRSLGGHIVGTMTLDDCVSQSNSKWFFGPYGLVLKNRYPISRPFPCKGSLGLFNVEWPY